MANAMPTASAMPLPFRIVAFQNTRMSGSNED
jgi:hypothetical protein